MDAGPGVLRHACIEAALPALLRDMYPGWRIWEAAGRWHACRRGNFRQVFESGAPLYAVHAGDPAGLWARLVTETNKKTILPILADAGDGDYRKEVPSCPPRRVHKPGRGRDGASATTDLRLL